MQTTQVKVNQNFSDLQQVRVVIADSHPIFRDGLRRLLEAKPNLKVLDTASNGTKAVKLARQLKPDILLLDLVMPWHSLDLVMPWHSGMETLRVLSAPTDDSPVRVIL